MSKRADAVDLDAVWSQSVGDAGLATIFDWIALTSLWTDRNVCRSIGVVHPRTRRRHANEEYRTEVDGIVAWRNEPAANAFWKARGVSLSGSSPRGYRNAVLCHIYENSAHDPQHFTHLANLTVLPRAVSSLTEWTPVRNLLKWMSFTFYGYLGPAAEPIDRPIYVPPQWPGVPELSAEGANEGITRLSRLKAERPRHIPRQIAR